jgi:FkbM family methyltransferase
MADWARGQPLLRRCARGSVRLIPDVRWTVRVPDLGPIRIRLRRHRWFLFEEFGREDTFVMGVFARLVREGDVVYDIGANIGVYTRVLACWFDAGRIVAFEPMGENVELLRENVRLGGLEDRVRIMPIALSDSEGQETLQVDDVTSGTAVLDSISGGRASAGRAHLGLPPRTERVVVSPLDRVIEREELPPPDVMKVDTEGAEALVLAGATGTLRTHRPRLAVALHGPDKARQTFEILEAHEYFCYGFVRDKGESVYGRLHPDDADRLANNNVIASCDEADVRDEVRHYTR